MVKTSIRPLATEIVYKNNEHDAHFDAFVYDGASAQEKNLGSLYVIGKVKYGDEDLSYLINLASSLARREYYSHTSDNELSPKLAFERTLKKLNEILEDFFEKKSLKLSMGVVALAGEDIFISRIGNIKVSLARNDRNIDVINNIGIFNQEHNEEKEFSNVISGKLEPNDKLFIYLPLRPIVAREKALKDLLGKETQATFVNKLEALSKNSSNFSCCGIHVEFGHIKEVPVVTTPSYYASMAGAKTDIEEDSPVSDNAMSGDTVDKEIQAESEKQSLQPRIIPADVSLAHRKSPGSFIGSLFKKTKGRHLFIARGKNKNRHTVVGAAGLVVLVGILYFFVFSGSEADKEAITKAKENLKTAQSQISQNDTRSARSLLQASIVSLIQFDSKNADEVRSEITGTLNSIDKTSDKRASQLADVSSSAPGVNKIVVSDKIYLSDAKGKIYSINGNTAVSFADTKTASTDSLLAINPYVVLIDKTSNKINSVDKKSGKVSSYDLKDIDQTQSVSVYEGNLYVLNSGSIIKYTDVATDKSTPSNWSKDKIDRAQSIAADGNIYILTNDGKLLAYFKGNKEKEFDLGLIPSSDASIYTHKDLPFIYLLDKSFKKIMVVDKSSGNITISYSLENISSISDISVANDQSIYILSTDNKVWSIK